MTHPKRRAEDLQTNAERRHWRAFWDELPGWVKMCIMAGCGVAGTTGVFGLTAPAKPEQPAAYAEQAMERRMIVVETKFDSLKDQLDRMENKLDRMDRRGSR